MLKRLFLLFSFAVLTLSACGTLEVGVGRTSEPTATQPQPSEEAKPTPGATYTPTLEAATSTLDVTLPTFSDVSFFRVIKTAPNCGNNYQRKFPARVRQIYASWQYANMRAGLTVRREWYLNGKLWLQREEAWDFAKYGAQGTISDISIYDLDAGLDPGDYELRLYINGQSQFDAQSKIGFLVDTTWTVEIASPNSQLTAIIADPQKLMIREADGTTWELSSAKEITSLAWFPDNRHIVYSDVDHSEQKGCGDPRIRSELWVIDTTNGEQHQIGTADERLHNAQVSPDGGYIAAFDGTGFGDACWHDQKLIFIKLDEGLKRVEAYRAEDFAGIPTGTPDSVIFPAGSSAWQDNTHFETGLDWTCMPQNNNPRGIYFFDLAGMQAARTGDLPNP